MSLIVSAAALAGAAVAGVAVYLHQTSATQATIAAAVSKAVADAKGAAATAVADVKAKV
jgi:hypothetical protein